jgi:hypothetical protein
MHSPPLSPCTENAVRVYYRGRSSGDMLGWHCEPGPGRQLSRGQLLEARATGWLWRSASNLRPFDVLTPRLVNVTDTEFRLNKYYKAFVRTYRGRVWPVFVVCCCHQHGGRGVPFRRISTRNSHGSFYPVVDPCTSGHQP